LADKKLSIVKLYTRGEITEMSVSNTRSSGKYF
jgi:hypothetical protein